MGASVHVNLSRFSSKHLVQEFVKEKAEYLPLLEQTLNDWSNKNEKETT